METNNIRTITEDDFLWELKEKGISMDEVPALLIGKLSLKGLKIATAESCTGGLISKLITDQSGASSVFDCGVCSYANCIKEKVLGVSHKTLDAFGAVSPDTAKEMAEGILRLSDADISVSTTGIAGPSGGTPDKPVGLVYIGIATKARTDIIKADFSAKNNNRDKNRQLSASLALYCVLVSI